MDLLIDRSANQGDKLAYIYLKDGEIESDRWTYRHLEQRARIIAARLETLTEVGERALLLYPPGLEFIAAFMGCLYAGVTAVPVYPPRRNRPDPRLDAIVKDARPTLLLTAGEIQADMENRIEHTPGLQGIHLLATDGLEVGLAENWKKPAISGGDLAFLQYTSGSTGTPKGVMVSHENLLHNQRMIKAAFGHSERTVFVSWLPVYHDMGLIGSVLQPLYLGIPCTLMAPVAFLQKPFRWLQAIARYRATTSGAPNFAYGLCVEKITPEQKAGLDLSSWEIAFNGAEPVRAETLARFTEAFRECGFRHQSHFPCYGMAESTLLITGSQLATRPDVLEVDRSALTQGRIELQPDTPDRGQSLVGCGQAWAEQKLLIVDPESRTSCPENRVGEIWVSGRSVARGYWERQEENLEIFAARLSDTGEGPYLRTGDLGVMVGENLVVTGRLKDMIIVNGRNHYPQDIETTVERAHPALRPGGGAAFSVESGDAERLVVVQEVTRENLRNLSAPEVIEAIRQAVWDSHELQIHGVQLLKPATAPKTSSGKIQRRACRQGYLSGSLEKVAEWRDEMRFESEREAPGQEQGKTAPGLAMIQAWLVNDLAQRLRVPAESIDVREPFARYGLDSVDAVGLAGDLETWLGRKVPPMLAYDYPTVEALAQHLGKMQRDEISALQAVPPEHSQTIAIIGLGCRLPGADSPEAYWDLLRQGGDAIGEIPPSRWDSHAFYHPIAATPGKMNTRWGGFLTQVDQFDPQFFGIAQGEATMIDPQHRLLLEVGWEALEHSGLAPERLAGSNSGVFFGISNSDYSRLQFAHPQGLNAYLGVGNAFSIAANRLSYLLDWRGPSVAVDTACSSSLVAVHQACESLRRGDCDLALAGGVNLILSPELTIALSQAQMMAPDGRCKTFAETANGYVRSEGCGVVVLKRYDDAVRDGDRVLACIRGSAVNQDGRTNGLTAPNGLSQQAVIRQACRHAKVEPAVISFIETHGTGTQLGDPIEVNALREVLGSGRIRPCWLGSVKANIGHLESAAGIASLIKLVLALQNRKIPPQPHVEALNPHIVQDVIAIPTRLESWQAVDDRRVAGLSSFGFGGTNAHIVIEEAPPQPLNRTPQDDRSHHLLTLSARNAEALRELALRYADYLREHPAIALADLCYSANTGRNHFDHRLAAVAQNGVQLEAQLRAFAAEGRAEGVISARVVGRTVPPVAFLFTGQGSQYPGMGGMLYDTQPVFRAALDACDSILKPCLGVSLVDLLYREPELALRLDQTVYTQPALFALQVALTKLWNSWGVEATAVMGHSLGEYSAAWLAGCFDLEDGLKLVAERARLMQALPEEGAMWAVRSDSTQVMAVLDKYSGQGAVIAAVNSPLNTVISGPREVIDAAAAELRAGGIEATRLTVSQAFHSPLLEPVLAPLEQAAGKVAHRPARIPLVSNLTGQCMQQAPDARHWRSHSRQPVRFMQGVQALFDLGCRLFLEIGPHPVLSSLGRQCAVDENATWLNSLNRKQDGWQVLLQSLAQLYMHGVPIDWGAFDRPYPRNRLHLPTYPFQRQRYWLAKQEIPMTAPSPSVNAPAPVASESRIELIRARLKAILANLLQTSAEKVDVHTPLLEMGADSLLLMSAVQTIEKTFALQLSVRQLFEELATLHALAAYIDENLAVDLPWLQSEARTESDATVAMEVSAVSASVATTDAKRLANDSNPAPLPAGLEGIINSQLQLMAQQLQLLGGASSAAPVPQPSSRQQPPPAQADPGTDDANVSATTWHPVRTEARPLAPQQQRYLNEFIARYNRRTQRSKQEAQEGRLRRSDMRAILGFRPETKEMCYPIVGASAQGGHIQDVDGNDYIDISMGFGVHLFGHNAPFIRSALEEQFGRGIQLGPQAQLTNKAASLLCELTGNERMTFATTGTEAVMSAVRLVRSATRRGKIVVFTGSYHGHSDGVLAVAQSGSGQRRSIAMGAGIPQAFVNQTLVLDYGESSALEAIKAHRDELAAVLVEPVQSRRPDLQPASFLHELRGLTRECRIPLIFDEMITGLRTHPRGAQAWFGIEADLSIYGKVLGGGMPIGAVAGNVEFLDPIDGGQWNYGDDSLPGVADTFTAGTFNKHPLSLAGACAVLEYLKAQGPGLQERLNERTARLANTLNAYFQSEGVTIEVSHFGSMFRFAWAGNTSYVYQPLDMDLFFFHLIDKGIYVWEGRTCFLSTAHTEEDLERVTAAVVASVDELRSAGFLLEQSPNPPSRPSSAPAQAGTAIRTPSPARIPLSAAQKQLWAVSMIDERGSLAYHSTLGLTLRGVYRHEAMAEALRRIIERHDALRTLFDREGEEQRVLPVLGIDIEFADLAAYPGGERDTRVGEWFETHNRRPFDLERGPLLRVAVLKLEERLHLLVLSAHQIVADGWSVGVIVQELATLYAAICQGKSPTLAVPMQYGAFLDWQRSQSGTAAMAGHEGYWQEQLDELPPLLDLPTDRPRPLRRTFRQGGRLSLRLDADFTSAIKRYGKERGCTLFMTMLAANLVLLHRLANQPDVVICIPMSGRTLDDAENMVGFCAPLLPIRSRLEGEETFTGFLAAIKKKVLGAFEHQDYPFAQLLERLRDRGGSAEIETLVAAVFNLERPMALPPFHDLETALYPTPIGYTAYDLSLNVMDLDQGLVLDWDYDVDLFDASTMAVFLHCYQTLLEGIVTATMSTIAALPLLNESERRRQLVDWNATAREYPKDRCVHELFEEQAARTPEAVAVVQDDCRLSYAELNARANRLAHHLRGLGVRPDERVAICLERGLEMVVGLLAVLKAGGAYVPLDPAYPTDRLGYILENSAPMVLLTQRGLDGLSGFLRKGLPVVDLDADSPAWADQPDGNLGRFGLTPAHLAYVIYTSGSTGNPKGVMIEHRMLVNYSLGAKELFGLSGADTVLQQNSLNFDLSVEEIFPALLAGAALAPSARIFGLRSEGATAVQPSGVHLPAAHWHTLVAEWERSPKQAKEQLRGVRLLNVTGDALSPQKLQAWETVRPESTRLVNTYGPTEATVSCTAAYVRHEPAMSSVTIGKPMANARLYILDPWGQPAPIGAAGEIHIGGAGVARGYLNRPDLTHERFLPDPFAPEPGARMYKSGDLGRWLADGNIEFLGRNDFQVKVRGFRIELGEIEAQLAGHPSVREAAVLALGESGDKRLVAYYTGDETLAAETLHGYLEANLPEYMVPVAYVRLAQLPLTPNGKLDRQALPDPAGDAFAVRVYEAPQGEVEQTLARLWGELLKIERVGRQDNFFELTLIERMRREGLHADVRALFGRPSLAGLAAAVSRQSREIEVPPNRIPAGCEALTPPMLPLVALTQAEIDRIVETVPGGAANVQDIYPLAPLQEGIFFHHMMSTHGDAYLLRSLVAFDSRERLDGFLDAMQAMVDRHDILRTSVVWEGLPEPVQVVWREVSLPVEEVDLDLKLGDAAQQLRDRFDPRSFQLDVRVAPLMRAYIAHDPRKDRWLFLLISDHLSLDHISLEILLEEMQVYVLGQAKLLPAPLPFRNFVAQARLGLGLEDHEAFFRNMLGEVDEPTAPFGLLDVHGDGKDVGEARLSLDLRLARRLRERAQLLGVSVASLCHLAWALVLARTTGRKDVVFGTLLFGRMQGGEGADRVLGMFINTLPLMIRVDEGGVLDSVRQTHALLTELMHHEHAPLALAQRCSSVAAPAPLFTSLLNYRYTREYAQAARAETSLGWEGVDMPDSEERTNYPIAMSMDDMGDGFQLVSQVQNPLDPARVCDFMSTALENLVEALEKSPHSPVCAIDVLPESERRRVLVDWNATVAEYPK
ncbi:MAG: amino acid adenylation domain-containing protein, partial [Methylococcaceae bacterium]|nr:amino acid adenylation domain-containing protein [Methylococcaceae bacterium]